MYIVAGETEIPTHIDRTPAMTQRREEVFIQIGLGLLNIDNSNHAQRLAAVLGNKEHPQDARQQAIDELRAILIEFRRYPGFEMPTLGMVLEKAYDVAKVRDQRSRNRLVQQFVKDYQPALTSFQPVRRVQVTKVTA